MDDVTGRQVCFVVNGFGTLNPSSGIAAAYEGLALELARDAWQVRVAYMNQHVNESLFFEAAAMYAKAGVELLR